MVHAFGKGKIKTCYGFLDIQCQEHQTRPHKYIQKEQTVDET